MADFLSIVKDLFSTEEPPELLGHRIQKSLQVILAGLDDRDTLAGADVATLRRELRMLLQLERVQIATAEMDKAELVLQYMLRPSFEECLSLWFGKSEQTDQEIWTRFGSDVALASKGHYDHWALDAENPRLLVALVIMLDQFPRNMYRDTPEMYACDARCRDLVKRGLRVGAGAGLRPIERVFLCLVLTHSEVLDDQHLCMEEWGRAMEELAPDDPLNAFHEIFHRHVAVIKRFGRFPHRNKILQRADTLAEEEFLANSTFRFDLPLLRRPDGAFVFAGTVKRRTVKLLDHEYETLLPDVDEAPLGRSSSSTSDRTTSSPGPATSSRSKATSASATASPTSPPRRAWDRSISTTSSTARGACCFRILRISRRCARPSSGSRPSSRTNGGGAA
jgi:uncharacterized protein (DUF924 family)